MNTRKETTFVKKSADTQTHGHGESSDGNTQTFNFNVEPNRRNENLCWGISISLEMSLNNCEIPVRGSLTRGTSDKRLRQVFTIN